MVRRIALRASGLFILSFLLVCFIFSSSYGQKVETPEITDLESNKPVERAISGGQKHIFQIKFAEKQYARINIEQRGIDIVARLLDRDGKVAVEYDFDPRNKGAEIVEMTAPTAGNYQLTVEPKQKNAAGRYEIRLIELRTATEKELAIDETRKLINDANRLWRAGNNQEALPLAERALAIREKELGAENYDVSQALLVVANIDNDLGDYQKAETFYQRALDVRERVLGKDHFSVSLVLNNFGDLYKMMGDYTKAEMLFNRALEIREKNLEPNHLLIASVLNNLGNLVNEKGETAKAAGYYQRVLEIREKALGPETADVAAVLNNIANLYPDVAKAEPLFLRALAIKEKVFGPDNQEVAQTLYNLATLYSTAGDYAKAKPLCERSLAIYEKTLGSEHPFSSYPMNLLAVIYKNTGEFAKAEELYRRTIALKEKTQGSFHPHLGGTLSNLANLYALEGEIDQAILTQTRANSILEYSIALNLATGSEQEKLSYLKTLDFIEDQTLSLNFQAAPNSTAAANLAVTTILQRKGRVLDAMSDNLSALRRRFNKEDQSLLDGLNDTTTRLVGMIFEGPQGASSDAYQKNIKTLEDQREDLESRISRQSAGFYEQRKPVELKDIQRSIPPDAALIEFAVYRPVSPKTFEFLAYQPGSPEGLGNPRYVVYVVPSQGDVKCRDLGDAKTINATLSVYRQALRSSNSKDFKQIARTVEAKIIEPVLSLLGEAKHLLISPDGDLNLIPFEALVDAQNHFLIENYAFTYLTSGRELLRMQVARESKSKPLIVANPFFGVRPNAADSMIPRYFAPLGGTAQEARSIQALFPDATFLSGAEATESALKQTIAPSILHIATHGFFLEDSQIPAKPDQPNNAKTKFENPLLRAGLALTGANNRRTVAGDDGILTALEASGLNLWGTKLVVLSACDTGLGEVRNGEGVYGLRRAFVLAGTESLVMSLWSVSDLVTRELMTSYYKNLKQGVGRGAALRQVQLEMLKNPARRHPFYWAGFIQSGEWANLEGKR
jgi:CHAT domain-containing protein/Tfp pilus assembly protein PilF